jgi:hypothetical protein
MKRRALLLGLSGALIVAGAATGLEYHARHQAQAESAAFAESSVRAITGSWNPDAMIERASPLILTPFVRQELPHAYARLAAKLGPLTQLSAPLAQVDNGGPALSSLVGGSAPAAYTFNARFAKAPGQVQIVMVRDGRRWEIVGLHIDSAALEEH